MAVKSKYNIFISGGTGSGKTTFLNALSEFIDNDERVITIEDAAELQINHVKNLVRLEARDANIEGKNEVTKKRMETMCISNDGFYISEQDLKLRGPGDFFGTRQHGLPEMRIANLFEDRDILAMSQEAAKKIMAEDRHLESEKYSGLRKRAESIISDDIVMN